MEFDHLCTMMQGHLQSLQKSVGIKFVDIDRDHDDEVQSIVKTLSSLVKERSVDYDGVKRMHMLLLLNTKWEHLTYFEEDGNFCHLLNSIPTMSRYLYFKLISTLGWHSHLGPIILHFPEFLVREILTSIEGDLKYIDSQCAVPFMYDLLANLFHKIMALQQRCNHRLTEFVKLFQSIAKFDFENVVAEMDCSSEKKYQYWGFVYRMLLDLLRVCIDRIQNFTIDDDEFYDYSCQYDYAEWKKAGVSSCRGKHCLGIIANKCIEVSDNVNVNMYMSWTEVDIIEESVEKTLQTCVRESAYKTRESISRIHDQHNSIAGLKVLEKRLPEIELKPTTEEDEISNADADTILVNLFNPKKTMSKWLRGLINIGIFESAPHMKVVAENARLIDEEAMTLLLNTAVKYLSNNSITEEEHATIRNTLKTCLKALDPNSQLEVLSTFLKTYSLIVPLQSSTFTDRVTFLFNQIVNDEDSIDKNKFEVVWLAIENCELLLKRSINECLSSKTKAKLILNLLSFVKPAVEFTSPQSSLPLALSHILTVTHSVKEAGSTKLKEEYLNLIEISTQLGIISAETFLFNHLIPMMIEPAVAQGNISELNFFLDIMTILEPKCNPKKVQYTAVLIIILNRYRPKINNFSLDLVEISTKAINLLEREMALIESQESGNEIKWLASLAEKAPPLTKLYLGPVMKSDKESDIEEEGNKLFWSLKGLGYGSRLTELKPHERTKLVTSTLKVLPSLTMKEWEKIGGGISTNIEETLYTFSVLVDSLLVLLQVPAVMQNLACFANIVSNFLYHTITNVVPVLKSKRGLQSIPTIREKIELLSSVLPEELRDSKGPQFSRLNQILDDLCSNITTKDDTNEK